MERVYLRFPFKRPESLRSADLRGEWDDSKEAKLRKLVSSLSINPEAKEMNLNWDKLSEELNLGKGLLKQKALEIYYKSHKLPHSVEYVPLIQRAPVVQSSPPLNPSESPPSEKISVQSNQSVLSQEFLHSSKFLKNQDSNSETESMDSGLFG